MTNPNVVFTALRRQGDGGTLPDLRSEALGSWFYFENQQGEQLVLHYDPERKQATLWHGDCNWQKAFAVRELTASAARRECVQQLGRVKIEATAENLASLQAWSGTVPYSSNTVLVAGVVLDADEQAWLAVCWRTARHRWPV